MSVGPNAAFVARLRGLLGDDGLLDEAHDIAPYRGDLAYAALGSALVVARPRRVEDVCALVEICAAAGVPITPRGGGTGLCGGAAPCAGSLNVVVSFERMRRIRWVDPLGSVMIVEAGCTLAQAQQAAAAAGRLLAIDHGGAGSSQIGGNLATNAGGNNVLRYGMARDQVLGLEVVLADGRLLSRLSPLRKNNAGYDLKQVFLGSEGTLGLITAAALRLAPAPVKRVTACIGADTPEAAMDFYGRARQALGEAISACELMSNRAVTLRMQRASSGAWPCDPATPWLILIEADSASRHFDLDAALDELLDEAVRAGVATGGTIASGEGQRASLWDIREGIAAAMIETGALKSDTSVPLSQVATFIRQAGDAVGAILPGCRPAPFGHLGDGNVHFNVLAPENMPIAVFGQSAHALSAAIEDVAIALGGSVSAEHGIGRIKREALRKMMTPVEIDLMRRLKQAWDPVGLLNQGKILFSSKD